MVVFVFGWLISSQSKLGLGLLNNPNWGNNLKNLVIMTQPQAQQVQQQLWQQPQPLLQKWANNMPLKNKNII